MLREVHLHGGLHPEPVHIHGSTIAEIVDGLSRQIPGLRPDPIHGRKVLQVKGVDTEEDLYKFLGPQEEIHIFPVLEGEKGKFTQIIVGATLIALSFVVPGSAMLLGTQMGTWMAQAGMMMMLGGIAQLLAPTPELDPQDDRRSRLLTTGRNTVAIGTRIPILYGEFRCGGHYLSVNINAKETSGND